MMCPVRRPTVALAGLVLLAAAVVAAHAARRPARRPEPRQPCAPCSDPASSTGPAGSRSMRPGTSSSPTPATAASSWCRPAAGVARRPPCPGRARRHARRRQLHGAGGPSGTRAPWRSTGDGDVFVAEATAQRVQEVRRRLAHRRHGGRHRHGGLQRGRPRRHGERARRADRGGGGRERETSSSPTRPTAGCAWCPAASDHALRAGRDGRATSSPWPAPACAGAAGQGGPLRAAQLWNPVAVTLDARGRSPRRRQRRPVGAAGAVRRAAGTFYGIDDRRGRHRRGRGRHGELRALRRRRAAGQRADRRAERPPRTGRRPDGRALRHRRLHARHPGRARRRPDAARPDA